MRFVCDFGFSSAKWLVDGKKGRVISVYQEHGGERTLIGEDALDNPGGVAYIRTPQHLVRYYPLFLEKCLDEAGIEGEVEVGVGLPAQFWEEQRKIKGGSIDILGQTLISDRVKKVTVLPQGLGGIRSHIAQNPLKGEGGLILGVDIGFNTIIYTLYDPKRGIVTSTDTLYKRGISQMAANYLMPKIAAFTTGLSLTPVELSRLMEQGYFTAGTDKHDLLPEIKAASEEYIDNILSEILEDVKANISITRPLETIVFFGGGATHLKGRILSNQVEVQILPEPEFANATGFMCFLEA